MFGLEPGHLIVVLIVALVLFGPKKLPQLGQAIGKSIHEFKNAATGITEEIQNAANATREDPKPKPLAKAVAAAPQAGQTSLSDTEQDS